MESRSEHLPALKRQPFDARDGAVLGALLAGAAVIASFAQMAALPRAQSFVGLLVILAIGYAASTNRRAINLRTIGWGLVLQVVFALIVLKTGVGQLVFAWLGGLISQLLNFSFVGSSFVFGAMGDRDAWPRVMTTVLGSDGGRFAVVFAFQVLPTIIFVAALFAVFYYLGVMQAVVSVLARPMNRIMHASGAESLNVAASIFMGQTEAPLTIRPYLPRLTHSEIMTVMTAGMAHISGGIMAAYVLFGIEARHLLTAVIMTAPGTLMMAKLFVPETQEPQTRGTVKMAVERTDVNVIDAAGRGTTEGMHLAINVAAMLVSFLSIIALLNAVLGWAGGLMQGTAGFGAGLSLQQIFGWVFAPVAWSMGVPWKDAPVIGNLLGTRMILNEFVAFSQLGPMKGSLDPRSFTIATYALCGFANLGSIGIQIGGIGALVPERRHDLARLGLRAMIAGTLANFVTATIAGFLL